MPLTPAKDLHELDPSSVYIVSSRPLRATLSEPVSNNKKERGLGRKGRRGKKEERKIGRKER